MLHAFQELINSLFPHKTKQSWDEFFSHHLWRNGDPWWLPSSHNMGSKIHWGKVFLLVYRAGGKQSVNLKSWCQRKERSYERGKYLSSQGSRQQSSSSLHSNFSTYALDYDLHIPALRRVSRFRNGEATPQFNQLKWSNQTSAGCT